MRKRVMEAVILAAGLAVACGEGIGGVTSGTSSGPSSNPTPSATATPRPSATPTPAPTPVPGALSCALPSLPLCDANCCTSGGSNLFRNEIETAEDNLTKTQPGLFLPNGDVKDKFEYIAALAKKLTELTGLCAQANGHDELRVKRDQTISNHVDVLIADETPWVGGVYTCRPASF